MGETKFHPREFPRSGSKAEDVKEREKGKRGKVNDYNSQYLSPEPIKQYLDILTIWFIALYLISFVRGLLEIL